MLQFTSPAANPTIELSPAGTASVSLTVNQSVTFTLANPNGEGKPPLGASLSPTTGTSTTFTYAAPLQPCSGTATPVQVNVVATSASSPPQSTVITVAVVQSPPCLTALPVVVGNQTYAGCPATGTLLNGTPTGALAQVGVFAQAPVKLGSTSGIPYGVPPFTWTLTGALPAGLSLAPGPDTSSVVITGTPVSAGCSTFQIQVTDAAGGLSCDPTVTSSCVPTTFHVVVIPASLKVQVPAYSFSYDGVPYPPIALLASGGVLPYTWQPDPSGLSTLPPGLALSSVGANPNYVVVSGTPNLGDSNGSNAAGSGNPGSYPSLIQVNDSQLPYPALGSVTLKLQDYLPPTACSAPASTPLYVQPSGPAANGGILSGGAVLADNYLQGTYAFQLRGFDAQQPTVISGSMTLDGNGNVTAGEEDITRGATSAQTLPVSSGSYAVGVVSAGGTTSYNRGCATLTTSAGTLTFDFTVGGCGNAYSEGGALATSDNACGMKQNSGNQNIAAGTFTTGRVIEADDGNGQSGQLSGILRAQNTASFSAGLSGPFAFGLGGWDSALGHYAMAGSLQASSGSLNSAAADVDDAGTLSSQLTGGSGTLGAADSNGRIAASLTLGSASYDFAFYQVSASEAFVVTTDPLSSNHPLLTGEALATAGSFSNASLQSNQMLAMGGLSSTGPDVSIGLLTFDGTATVGGTVYEDQSGTLGTTAASAGYNIDAATGRTLFSTSQIGQTLGAHSFVAYVVPPPAGLTRNSCSNPASCITAFLVGTDNTAQDGVLEFQTQTIGPPPPFSNRFLAGDFVYGTVENLDWMTPSIEGDVYATPSSASATSGNLGTQSLPFFQDSSYGCLQSTCPLFLPDDTFTGAYVINANGTGSFGGATSISIANGNVVFYIDESPVNAHPSIVVAEQ